MRAAAQQQAKLALDEAIAGYTVEERGVAQAAVVKADAAIATLQAQVAELTVKAPTAAQVYQTSIDIGEFVSPGVPLLSLVVAVGCLAALRPARGSGQGSEGRRSLRRAACRRSATGRSPSYVRKIATRGEYAGWRATRATGDFDLRTFEIRAYPVDPVPGLRPGMSVYTDWKRRR